jgi:acyl-CoA dehydrogenase
MSDDLRGLLDESVSRLLADRVTRELLEAGERGDRSTELWRELESQGFVRPHVAAERGGAGGGWTEAFVVLRAAGRTALPLPVAETMLASALLDAARLAAPEGMLTVVPVPLALASAKHLTVRADRVPYGRDAAHVVFVAKVGGSTTVGVVDRRQAACTPGENLAREPRDQLSFERATIAAHAELAEAADLLAGWGALVRSAQMVGALETVLAKSVRYATERVQFGRPIGSFQVIQAALAVLAGQVAAAGAAAELAARAADRRSEHVEFDPTFEIAVAKIRAAAAAEAVTAIAHQVHGAIGFTYEHDLHFFTRRLWSWQAEFGSQRDWALALGRMAAVAGRDGLWPLLTSRPSG